jgi:hypothetical protein
MARNKMKKITAVFLFSLFLFMSACVGDETAPASGDTQAPSRGSLLTVTDIKYYEITFQWGEATDNTSSRERLRYRVVRSLNYDSINTVRECLAVEGADVILDWSDYVPSITMGGLVQSTTYYLSVLVKDEAGNIEIYYPRNVTTIANTAPTPGTQITYSNREKFTLTASWGAAKDGNYQSTDLAYRLVKAATAAAIDTVERALAVPAGDVVMDWSQWLTKDVTGLTESTRYYFAVIVKNPENKMSLYAPRMTTTKDETPPVVPVSPTIYANGRTMDTITVAWPAASDTLTYQSDLQYMVVRADNPDLIDTATEAVSGAAGITTVKGFSKNYTGVTDTGLAEYTGYYYAVVVKDEWENMEIYSPVLLRTLDVKDPVVQGEIEISNRTKNSMRVTWAQASDAEPGVNQANLQYRLVKASDPSKISEPKDAANTGDVVMEWKFGGGAGGLTWDMNDKTYYDVTGLTEGETYYFAVVVKDLDGNMSIYPPKGAATPDETPPTIGTGVIVSGERSTSLSVSWGEASDNITPEGNLQYKVVIASSSTAIDTKSEVEMIAATYPSTIPGIVLVDENLWKSDPGGKDWIISPPNGVRVTGFELGKTYHFAVLVKDAAGNTSFYMPNSGTTKESWEPIGEETFPLTSYEDSFSLKLNASNVPYVAYLEGETGIEGRVSVRKYNSGSWGLVGSAGFSGESAISVDLELGSDGTPYVVYKTTPVVQKIDETFVVIDGAISKVMKYDGDTWVNLGSPVTGVNQAHYIDIGIQTIDSIDTLFVAFSDLNNDYKVTAMNYIKPDLTWIWNTHGVFGDVSANPVVNSLVFNTSGVPYMVYQDKNSDATPVVKATVMRYFESSWELVGNAEFGSGEILYATLALDSSNVPYIALMNDVDASTGLNIIATVMKLNGSTWERVGSSDSLSGGQVSSLALAMGGTVPYVAFSDNVNSWKASVMKYTGGGTTGWEAIGSRGFTADSVGFLSLAIDSGGKPYMAYRDAANSNKLTVVVYQ